MLKHLRAHDRIRATYPLIIFNQSAIKFRLSYSLCVDRLRLRRAEQWVCYLDWKTHTNTYFSLVSGHTRNQLNIHTNSEYSEQLMKSSNDFLISIHFFSSFQRIWCIVIFLRINYTFLSFYPYYLYEWALLALGTILFTIKKFSKIKKFKSYA